MMVNHFLEGNSVIISTMDGVRLRNTKGNSNKGVSRDGEFGKRTKFDTKDYSAKINSKESASST
jgi:hypothetical protein